MRNTAKRAGAAIFLSLFLLTAGDTQGAAPPGCDLKSTARDLQTMKTGDGDSPEEARAKLGIRRALIVRIADCLAGEAYAVQAQLASADLSRADVRETQSRLAARMQELVDYYASIRSTANELGIRGTQDAARKMRERRETSFAAGAELASNFLVWLKNEKLLKTAADRLSQVQGTMRALELVGNEEIEHLFDTAQISFREGQTLQNDALGLLRRMAPPDEAALKLQLSVAKLSETYATLLELSDMVARLAGKR